MIHVFNHLQIIFSIKYSNLVSSIIRGILVQIHVPDQVRHPDKYTMIAEDVHLILGVVRGISTTRIWYLNFVQFICFPHVGH